MNANIEIKNITEIGNELIGDLHVSKSDLVGTQINSEEIPDLIDEVPILTFIASQAEGVTSLRGSRGVENKGVRPLRDDEKFYRNFKWQN